MSVVSMIDVLHYQVEVEIPASLYVDRENIDNYIGGILKVRLNRPFDGEVVVSRLKATDFKE
jgi:hypothetical protein